MTVKARLNRRTYYLAGIPTYVVVAELALGRVLSGAHARLARDGLWITNEKTLLARAGWGHADALFSGIGKEPYEWVAFLDRIRAWCDGEA